MSLSSKFQSYDNFQKVEDMNPTIREQQYAFNGRIFLPPSTEKFNAQTSTVGGSDNDVSKFYGRGRIQIEKGESVKPYELYKDSSKQQDTNVSLISNIIVPNALSRTFFSNDNVERLQRQIISRIYTETSKQIGKQSYQELQIIMKSMYLQYSKNLNTDIEGQVVLLNKYVVDDCVHTIKGNVSQYEYYLKDITSPIPVRTHPQSSSNKGYKYGDFSSLIPSPNID
jgi:hypothetical protein